MVGCVGAETIALYTIHEVKHIPLSGQLLGSQQLHVFLLAAGAVAGARTLALCVAIMDAIFRMQL